MENIVLLGARHSIQRGEMQKEDFESYIKQLCNKHNIRAIAEEIDDKDMYVAQIISKTLELKYLIIEPTPDEKIKLDINEEDSIIYELTNKYDIEDWDKQYSNNDLPANMLKEYNERLSETYRQREDEWLKRVKVLDTWPLLVICGDAHSQAFSELLVSSGIKVIKKYTYR